MHIKNKFKREIIKLSNIMFLYIKKHGHKHVLYGK